MSRRVVSLWFPRFASDRALRLRPVEGPFALTLTEGNVDRLHCANAVAVGQGLSPGMSLTDARALQPGLQTRPADPRSDAVFLRALARWAGRYCPWVGLEGRDGLVLDVTGAAHLFGGEAAMLDDMRIRLSRAGLTVQLGLAGSRGGAWALARFGQGIAAESAALRRIGPLPITALRLEPQTCIALERLGLRTVADLHRLPRATVTRRFGPGPLLRLDQALGEVPEAIAPLPDPPVYSTRLTLPDPIGLTGDVMAGTARLLDQLCARLKARETGARVLRLTLRRVDMGQQQVELRLASAMRDPARILPLFDRGVAEVEAGFGIDQMRLEAVQVEDLPVQQLSHAQAGQGAGRLDDLMTRIGNRIGLENIHRFLPADSHIPERSFLVAAAAWSDPGGSFVALRPRPLRLFPPEPVTGMGAGKNSGWGTRSGIGAGTGRRPPRTFRWRAMSLTTERAAGPERIAPEWWLQEDAWRSGMRDYWKVDTRQGRRLWLYHTPQAPGWFVQGEFA